MLFKKPVPEFGPIFPILISSFGAGLAFGGFLPLISLWLESKGTSFSGIGIIGGSSAVGVIFIALFAEQIVQKTGYLKGAVFGLILSAFAGVMFRFADNESSWILLRIIAGVGFGLNWIITEAWLGQIVSSKNRTKAVSLYVLSMALGFSTGPIIIWSTGFLSILPFFLIGAIEVISVLPLLLMKKQSFGRIDKRMRSPLFLISKAPTIATACILVGFVDIALISLFPVLVSRTDDAIINLVFILPITMGIGNFVLQYPIASLADKIGKRKTANFITIIGTICCACVPFNLNSLVLATSLTFVGCGLLYCMYTISLSMLSERYKGGQLIAANASFVILFEIANLIGPPVAGKMIDYSLMYGLSFFLILSGGSYLVVAKIRDYQKRN